jgi:hypothetical protein
MPWDILERVVGQLWIFLVIGKYTNAPFSLSLMDR